MHGLTPFCFFVPVRNEEAERIQSTVLCFFIPGGNEEADEGRKEGREGVGHTPPHTHMHAHTYTRMHTCICTYHPIHVLFFPV